MTMTDARLSPNTDDALRAQFLKLREALRKTELDLLTYINGLQVGDELRSCLEQTAEDIARILAITAMAQSSEGETIDDAPSCGQENDYRRARSSAGTEDAFVHDLGGLIEHSLSYVISSKDARIAARIALRRLGSSHDSAKASAGTASELVAFINSRLADLAEANALYGKDQRLGAPDKIARNDCEILWLKDLRSIIVTVDHAQTPAVPNGYVLVPRELTAENGAKSALIGEFSETFDYMDDKDDECQAEIPVSWTTIKAIHKKMVSLFALSQSSTEGK